MWKATGHYRPVHRMENAACARTYNVTLFMVLAQETQFAFLRLPR